MIRRILLLLVTSIAGVLLFANPVSAHNSLMSSDPADGAVLEIAPTQLTLLFAKSVPLDTLSIEIIDASGVRADLNGAVHGPNGDTQVLAPLPVLAAGPVTLRWRLVGPDGHPITGRVSFTISAQPVLAAPTTVVDPAALVAAPGVVTSTLGQSAVPAPSSAAAVQPVSSIVGLNEPWTTPNTLRWLLRFGSYLAIMAIGGMLATTAFVWSGAWDHPLIQRSTVWALVATLVASLAQLLVVASDIEASPPWAAFLGLLATWAYAGHSRSQRWPLLGVPLDVAHHAAAAAWIGGLAIIGLIAIRHSATDELIDSVNRFGRLAAISVAVIVGSGVLQAIRLVGSPLRLFAADHGKYLILKVVVLGGMLKVADINRQRISRRFGSAATTTPLVIDNLRRAMGTEFAVGLLVIAVTAAMVVSPPAVADEPVAQALANTNGASVVAAAESAASTTVAIAISTTVTSPLTSAGFAPASANAPTAESAAPCLVSGSSLQRGASNADVTCLQQALRDSGLLVADISGTFDDATDVAVRSLQTERGLVVDGIVGQVTATVLGIWPSP